VLWVAGGALTAGLKRDRGIFFETATSTWLASALAFGAASLVGRRRPCARGRHALIKCPDRPSFPSEHAAAAFAAARTLSGSSPGGRPIIILAAAAVAASRIRVGVHYPTDVIAGAALGLVVAKMVGPYFEPVE
jgi:undecaprenyl-diphosphatase